MEKKFFLVQLAVAICMLLCLMSSFIAQCIMGNITTVVCGCFIVIIGLAGMICHISYKEYQHSKK